MKNFLSFFIAVIFFFSSIALTWAGTSELTVNATTIGEKVILPDQSTFQWVDLEKKITLGGVEMPQRVGIMCIADECKLILPISDTIKWSKKRIAVVVIVVTAVVLRFVIKPSWLVGGGGNSSSGPAAVVGGGGGPPGGPGGIL